MIRTTILADDGLMLEIRSLAQRTGVSVSEIIRQALEKFIRERKKERAGPSFLGVGRSGGALKVSERDEEYLFQEKPRKSR
ncbi:MAG: ribbon-helix-helix protein, CopG family [Elusimicrobia bacterium]|nr:ribbon-helix-helix protein, CopG family [Elusimicrobiota bacterium]